MVDVDLILTGAGTVGPIETWSVQADATPVSVGDSSGGVGSVSVSVTHGEDSEFIINNSSTFVHPRLGGISGQVAQLGSKGATEATDTKLSLQLTTPLSGLAREVSANLVADYNALDLEAGSEGVSFTPSYGAMPNPYQFVRVNHNSDGSVSYLHPTSTSVMSITRITSAGVSSTVTTGIPTSTNGFVNGFVSDSSLNYYVALSVGSSPGVPTIYKLNSSGTVLASIGATGTGNGQFGSAFPASPNVIAISPNGASLYVADGANARIQVIATAGMTYSSQFAALAPYVIAADAVNVYVMSSDSLQLLSTYTIGGSSLGNVQVSGIKGVANFTPLALELSGNPANIGGSILSKATLIGKSATTGMTYIGTVPIFGGRFTGQFPPDISRFISNTSETFDASLGSIYLRATTTPSTNNNLAIRKYLSDGTTLQGLISYYLNLGGVFEFTYSSSSDPKIVAIPWSGDLWTKMKDLLSAYERELVVINDVPTIRDWGGTVVSIDNAIAGSVELGVDSRQSGAFLNIYNYNLFSGFYTIYDGSQHSDNISVGVGAKTITTLQVDNYPTFYSRGVNGSTSFTIKDSNGVDVGVLFTDYGGSLTIELDKYNLGSITVTLVGPGAAIPGFTAPFSLGSSLVMRGLGVDSKPVQYNMPTGGDAAKSSSENAKDINNVFINDLTRMYDSANRYSAEAAGGVGLLRFEIPISDIDGFGLPLGGLVSFKESVYRINSVDVNASRARVTAKHFVTTEAFDNNVSGKTTGQFDTFWAPNDSLDVKIKPLRPIV